MQGIPQIGPAQQPVAFPAQGVPGVPLVLGEIVRGEVLNILPNAVSMRVKKEILMAKSDIPLQKGGDYLFQVESLTGNEVKLKVLHALTKETAASGNTILKTLNTLKGMALSHDQIIAFKNIFGKMPELVLQRLPHLAALEKLFKGANALTDDTLKEAVLSSGGFFETKLRALILKHMEAEGLLPGEGRLPAEGLLQEEANQIIQNDLKGNLLKIKGELLNEELLNLLKESGVKAGELSQAVDKLLTHIEQQQLTSKLNTAFQTFIPFVWQGLKDGKMTFRESYHPREGEAEQSCVVALDLEKAGRLVTHVRLFADRLHIRFITENAHLAAALEANKPLLEQRLNEIGITCNSLIVEQQKTIDFENAISPLGLDIKV